MLRFTTNASKKWQRFVSIKKNQGQFWYHVYHYVPGVKDKSGSMYHYVPGIKDKSGSMYHNVPGIKDKSGSMYHYVPGIKDKSGSMYHYVPGPDQGVQTVEKKLRKR